MNFLKNTPTTPCLLLVLYLKDDGYDEDVKEGGKHGADRIN